MFFEKKLKKNYTSQKKFTKNFLLIKTNTKNSSKKKYLKNLQKKNFVEKKVSMKKI